MWLSDWIYCMHVCPFYSVLSATLKIHKVYSTHPSFLVSLLFRRDNNAFDRFFWPIHTMLEFSLKRGKPFEQERMAVAYLYIRRKSWLAHGSVKKNQSMFSLTIFFVWWLS